MGDVVVVVLDVTERLLVVLHQSIDLTVLALFNLVDLRLATQVQFVAKSAHFALVLLFDLLRLTFEVVAQLRHSFVVRLNAMPKYSYIASSTCDFILEKFVVKIKPS